MQTKLKTSPIIVRRFWPTSAESVVDEIQWQQEKLQIPGVGMVPFPRLTAYFADQGVRYKYSGVTHFAKPWPQWLDKLRRLVEDQAGEKFNSVLLNYYRDGRDSISWHSDSEPELGPDPVIASVSIGDERTFALRRKGVDHDKSDDISLGGGDLLIMPAGFQSEWLHCVPKTKKPVGKRVNFTFRNIVER